MCDDKTMKFAKGFITMVNDAIMCDDFEVITR